MTPPFEVTFRIVRILEELGIEYHLGGSFASSLHGVPRQTHDVDLVAALSLRKAAQLVARLSEDFYADLGKSFGQKNTGTTTSPARECGRATR